MKSIELDYERLPEVCGNFQGVGIPGLTAKLIMRTDKKALYYRWDDCYEVFRITIQEASEVFGKKYPAHESYPGNEEFGKIAWAFKDKKNAIKRYNAL